MREYRYRVDRDGRIFHDETEVVDPHVLAFFVRAMRRTEDGRYLVMCQGEQNWFEADGTPFVVQRIKPVTRDGKLDGLDLVLAGDYREPLEPATLDSVGGRLYCRVRRSAFPARFGRLALQQIGPYLLDQGGRPSLVVGGRRYPILERERIAELT